MAHCAISSLLQNKIDCHCQYVKRFFFFFAKLVWNIRDIFRILRNHRLHANRQSLRWSKWKSSWRPVAWVSYAQKWNFLSKQKSKWGEKFDFSVDEMERARCGWDLWLPQHLLELAFYPADCHVCHFYHKFNFFLGSFTNFDSTSLLELMTRTLDMPRSEKTRQSRALSSLRVNLLCAAEKAHIVSIAH